MKVFVILFMLVNSINFIEAMDDQKKGQSLPPPQNGRKGRLSLMIPVDPSQSFQKISGDSAVSESIARASLHIYQMPDMLKSIREKVDWFLPSDEMPHLPEMLWRMKRSDVSMNEAHAILIKIIGMLDSLQREKLRICYGGKHVVDQREQDGALMIQMSKGYFDALSQLNFCFYCMRLCTQSLLQKRDCGVEFSLGKMKGLLQEFNSERRTVDDIYSNYYKFLEELNDLLPQNEHQGYDEIFRSS